MTGPEDGAAVESHGDGTFNVGSYDIEYLTTQWNNGGMDGRGETTSYGDN